MGYAQDFRRATEPEILDAIRGGQPLALAEAYHRVIPAAHAVARRLMPGATEVEEILHSVFEQLWSAPPQGTPLEAWVRRTTWAAAAERLRNDGEAPSSPSASGLLPDLPAPDVRFLDAAERAIQELPDDERRALLLAHDKGVASSAQDPGAGDALVRALLALAGPETSSADRTALHEDGCDDLDGLGDWCLAIADHDTAAAIERAIEERPGCAAKSRAVRRGRRRIEGLPATPDMGQRVLVTVLTSAGASMAQPPAPPVVAAAPDPAVDELGEDDTTDQTTGTPLGATAPITLPAEDTGLSLGDLLDDDQVLAGAGVGMSAVSDEPIPAVPDGGDDVQQIDAPAFADPMADTADLPASLGLEPGAEAPGNAVDDVVDNAPTTDTESWAPQPGDTSELRLSDILAGEDEDDDDPFAELDALEEDPQPGFPSDGAGAHDAPVTSNSPYAALESLDGTGDVGVAADAPFAPSADPAFADPAFADPNTEVFVEGQVPEPAAPERSTGGGMATFLSWLLPILGGAAIGVLLAVQVFGPPSGA